MAIINPRDPLPSSQLIRIGNGSGALLGVASEPSILTAQTSTVASVLDYTTPNDGQTHTYLLAGFLNVYSFASGSINLKTDGTTWKSTAYTWYAGFYNPSGSFVNAPNAATYWTIVPLTLALAPNTTVTIYTAGTFSLTYDLGVKLIEIL